MNPPEVTVDSKLARQLLSYSQSRDTQTGLLNYLSFQQLVETQLRDGPADQHFALLWIDLLNLRKAFSLGGWSASDSLVRRVAQELHSLVDAEALLGRFSGRCFLAFIRANKLDPADRLHLQAIVDGLSPIRGFGMNNRSEVAAGVSFYPDDTESSEDLVRFASLAASRANYVKSCDIVAFDLTMNQVIMRDHQLEAAMKNGLDQNQFSVFYQPKIDLRSGEVVGAEALSRWYHPEWGFVSPAEFIPIAERSDLIHRIFDHCTRTALRDTRRWRKLGLSMPIISVNASAADVRGVNFASSVQALIVESGLTPQDLELEMTESLLLDDESLFTGRVRELKALGVRISIDDFGTRYTGFNSLKHLPIDVMKIDKCFISGIDRSKDTQTLCQTIVAMARQLRLHTVAEGIEEQGELEALQEIGCEAGQGYLFQRPIPADGFTDFLLNWPARMNAVGFEAFEEKQKAESLCGIA